MKSKRRIAVFIFLAIIINLCLPCFAKAAGMITIYNCGEKVETVSGESISDVYIGLDRLELYDIDCSENFDSIYLSNGYKNATIFRSSNVVSINGVSITYYNGLSDKNGYEGVSLSLIAMIFSQICETDGNTVKLWMPYYPDNYVKGFISLPKGENAPKGGITAKVQVTRSLGASSGSGKVTPSVGYEYETFFEKNYFGTEEVLAEKNVIIEEGKNSVQYFLSSESSFVRGSKVKISVGDRGYEDNAEYDFSYSEEKLYSLKIGENKSLIKGSVNVETSAEKDTRFCVSAVGEKTYEFCGTIPKGSASSDFTLSVADNDSYKINVVFENKAYMRCSYGENVGVKTDNVSNINLYAAKAYTTKVTLYLPDGTARDEDTYGYLFLMSDSEPRYIADTASFRIPSGENYASVEFRDDRETPYYICHYELESDYAGLYDYGFYNKNKTVLNPEESTVFAPGEKIKINLAKSVDINAVVSLPEGRSAEKDIYGKTVLCKRDDEAILNEFAQCKNSAVFYELLNCYGEELGLLGYESVTLKQTEKMFDLFKNCAYDGKGELSSCLNSLIRNVTIGPGGGGNSGGGSSSGSSSSIKYETVVGSTIHGAARELTEKASRIITNIEKNVLLIKKGQKSGNVTIKIPVSENGFFIKLENVIGENLYSDSFYVGEENSTLFQRNAKILDGSEREINIELMGEYKISGKVTNHTDYEDLEVWAVYQSNLSNLKYPEKSTYEAKAQSIGDKGEYEIYVPSGFENFTVILKGEKSDTYYNSKGNTESLSGAEIIKASQNRTDINFEYNGFDPSLPLEVSGDENGDGYIYINAQNISDYAKNNISFLVGFYDYSGALSDLKIKENVSIGSDETKKLQIRVPWQDFANAATVKVFAWSDDLTPYSEISIVKEDGIGKRQRSAFVWLKSGVAHGAMYGDKIEIRSAPIVLNGELMCSARALAEVFGMEVSCEQTGKTITFDYGESQIIIKQGENRALCDGKEFDLSAPMCIYNDEYYVPVSDVVSHFGFDTEYDEIHGEMFVYTGEVADLANWAVERECVRDMADRDFSESLTKLDAAHIVAALFETASAEEMEVGNAIFSDTSDKAVLKLANAGIMEAEENGKFMPQKNVTDYEFAEIMIKALECLGEIIPEENENTVHFYNHTKLSEETRSTVYKLREYGAFDGVYKQIFPRSGYMTLGRGLAVSENVLRHAYDNVFVDIDPESPYKKTAVYLARSKIMNGYEDNTFRPNMEMTRSEVAVIISRFMGVSDKEIKKYSVSCDDVGSDHWANPYVGYCVSKGIMPLENNCWRPDEYVKNSEVICAVMNALGYKGISDFDEIYQKAKEIGVTDGAENINMQSRSLRLQVAQMIYNALKIK